MTRSLFGWDLPPGVTLNDIDNYYESGVMEESGIEEDYSDPFLPEGVEVPEILVADTLQDTEMKRQWASVNTFFNIGFVQGEDIWVHLSGGTDLKAVYLCERDGKAGIAVSDFEDGWLPVEAKYEKISLRLDD